MFVKYQKCLLLFNTSLICIFLYVFEKSNFFVII